MIETSHNRQHVQMKHGLKFPKAIRVVSSPLTRKWLKNFNQLSILGGQWTGGIILSVVKLTVIGYSAWRTASRLRKRVQSKRAKVRASDAESAHENRV